MEVIGKDDHGGDIEWMRGFDQAYGVPQTFDMIDQQTSMALGQIDGEEENAARVLNVSILHDCHCSLCRVGWR